MMRIESTKTLADAINQGYVVANCSYSVSNLYYRHVIQKKFVFTRVLVGGKYVTIEVDTPDSLVKISVDAANKIKSIFSQYDRKRKYWPESIRETSYLQSNKILREDAEEVARKIASVLREPGAVHAYTREELMASLR